MWWGLESFCHYHHSHHFWQSNDEGSGSESLLPCQDSLKSCSCYRAPGGEKVTSALICRRCRTGGRAAEFRTVLLLHPGSYYTVWKRDHEDDTEFIPGNASVIAVMEHISFAAAKRINFRPDSTPAEPISHAWPFTSARTYTVCHLIKRASSRY